MRPFDRPATSRRQILTYLNCPHATLLCGPDCWYLLYDDGTRCKILAVRVPRLRDKTLGEWVDLAVEFIYRD